MTARAAAALSVAGLAVAVGGQLLVVAPAVEDRLRARAERVLTAAGLPQVRVHLDGRDVELSGSVRSAADVARAFGAVAGVDGVRAVGTRSLLVAGGGAAGSRSARPAPVEATQQTRLPRADSADLTASVDDGAVRVAGRVPDPAARDAVLSVLTARFGAGSVQAAVDLDPTASGRGVTGFAATVAALDRSASAAVQLHAGRIAVAGVAPSVAVRDAATSAARRAVAAPDRASVRLRVAGAARASDAAAEVDALGTVSFVTGSRVLRQPQDLQLAAIAVLLERHPQVSVEVTGTGAGALGTGRATAVASALTGRGVGAARVVVTEPVADDTMIAQVTAASS